VSAQARKVRVADLIGSRIVDSDGHIIGLVVDLAVTDGPPYRLTGILSGGWEWIDRLEVVRLFRHHLRGHPPLAPHPVGRGRHLRRLHHPPQGQGVTAEAFPGLEASLMSMILLHICRARSHAFPGG
jgi:hypothetical protein